MEPIFSDAADGNAPAVPSGECSFDGLAGRGESTKDRVPSAAWADARRRDAGDAVTSLRSANAANAHAPPEPNGIRGRRPRRMGVAGSGSA